MIAELQEQLLAKNAQLLQLPTKHAELDDELIRIKSLCVAGVTVLDDLKSVAGACERPTKLAKMTRSRKESSATLLATAFLTLLTEQNDLIRRCEEFKLGNQHIPWLAAEARKLLKMLADREETDDTAKTTLKGRARKHASAADKQVIAPEALLADA